MQIQAQISNKKIKPCILKIQSCKDANRVESKASHGQLMKENRE